MRIVLDIQGFKDENNKFIPKELATFDGHKISHYIFKQPYSLNLLSPEAQKNANWLIKNHHGISWNKGFTPLHHFSEIVRKLTDDVQFVYVKGTEKTQYIKRYTLKLIIEINEVPVLVKSTPKCYYHSISPSMCALTNVFFLYNTFFMDE